MFGISTKFGHSIPQPLDLDAHSVKRRFLVFRVLTLLETMAHSSHRSRSGTIEACEHDAISDAIYDEVRWNVWPDPTFSPSSIKLINHTIKSDNGCNASIPIYIPLPSFTCSSSQNLEIPFCCVILQSSIMNIYTSLYFFAIGSAFISALEVMNFTAHSYCLAMLNCGSVNSTSVQRVNR